MKASACVAETPPACFDIAVGMENPTTRSSAALESHLDWLRSERAAFEQHQARGGLLLAAGDFAVGSFGRGVLWANASGVLSAMLTT